MHVVDTQGARSGAVGWNTVLQNGGGGVAVSIPDGAFEIFYYIIPSGCTVALGSSQPLK
jgi:hypothetical protein